MAEALARKLGLMERLGPEKSSKAASSNGPNHLIVLDFEATCWNKGKPSKEAEIIEFSAVILNLQTGNIAAEFQQYVTPADHPQLSEFCTNLTGITQDVVDNGVPLKTCLMLYSKWLAKLEEDIGLKLSSSTAAGNKIYNVIPVTWSKWDLGTCLPAECRRKRLIIPEHLTSWIDLRFNYVKHYSKFPDDLKSAVLSVGLKWRGKPHSGLDDARNTAHLAMVMYRSGATMVSSSGGTAYLPPQPASGAISTKNSLLLSLSLVLTIFITFSTSTDIVNIHER